MGSTVAAKRPSRAKPVEDPVDVDQVPDEAAIEPTRVIPPELCFTTDDVAGDEVPDEEDRTIEFKVDGHVCHIIAPHKLEEVLAQLAEAGARRANTADALFAGRRFLERVLRADTIDYLQRRLDDDLDPFRITHLFGILDRAAKILNEKLAEESRRARGGRGGRRR